MKKIISLLFFISASICFSQTIINGAIYDKITNEPLPYATIKLLGANNYYTITNEDGKFIIRGNAEIDSLEVRFFGFNPKKVPLSYFNTELNLYLTPAVYTLSEVFIVGKKDKKYAYNLLYDLVKKYRNSSLIVESKSFLSLTSSARGVPIEHIEGFYNSKQSISKGIIDLKIKSGRFGQNKSFPFYSLNNTSILKDFQLFKRANQILPSHPGNLTLGNIKSKYNVKIAPCNSCVNGDLSISFIPKKQNGRLFMGNIIFNKENLIIKKIDLEIREPKTERLISINENVQISPKEIKLSIIFNPLDFEKIQHVDFKFDMYYKSANSIEIINSHTSLYFYDYDNSFKESYFTSPINFSNDYDRIIASQASDGFWKANIQFPNSYAETRAIDFFKKYGYLINYENTISTTDFKYTNPSVILWSKEKRLEWENIKQAPTRFKNKNSPINRNLNSSMNADKVLHSISESDRFKSSLKTEETFKFSYFIDHYKNESGKIQFITRTIFDRNSSYYKYERTQTKLIYINLIFDIYEIYRQNLNMLITDTMTFDEVKILSKEKFKEAFSTVQKMKNETNFGLNFQNLIRWNSIVKSKIATDNTDLLRNIKL